MFVLGWCQSHSTMELSTRSSSPMFSLPSRGDTPTLVVRQRTPTIRSRTPHCRSTGNAQCPICLDPILLSDDVLTLGCVARSATSTPHQIHCTPCSHEWLRSLDATNGVVCPICKDLRHQLNTMTPGGTYSPHGCVLVLTWPLLLFGGGRVGENAAAVEKLK